MRSTPTQPLIGKDTKRSSVVWAIGCVVWLVFVYGGVSVLSLILLQLHGGVLPHAAHLVVTFRLLMIIGAALFFCRRELGGWKRALSFKVASIGAIGLSLTFLLGFMAAAHATLLLSEKLSSHFQVSLLPISPNLDLGLSGARLFAGFVFIVMAPFAEELWFRGYGIFLATCFLPSWQAILVTALAFGIVHFNPFHPFAKGLMSVITAVAFGFFLGWLRVRSGSLFLCLAIHLANNGFWWIYKGVGLSSWALIISAGLGGLALMLALWKPMNRALSIQD